MAAVHIIMACLQGVLIHQHVYNGNSVPTTVRSLGPPCDAACARLATALLITTTFDGMQAEKAGEQCTDRQDVQSEGLVI